MKKLFAAIAVMAVGLLACGSDEPANPGVSATTLVEISDSVDINGASLPQFQSGPDPAVGTIAPEVSGPGFTGKTVSINHDGAAKVIVFLAHWCPHCQDEVAELAPFFSDLEVPAGVELYSVATSTTPTRRNYPPSDWLLEAGWQVPVLVDNADFAVANAYGLSSFPYWVVLDGDGVVLTRISGGLGIQAVEGLLGSLASF